MACSCAFHGRDLNALRLPEGELYAERPLLHYLPVSVTLQRLFELRIRLERRRQPDYQKPLENLLDTLRGKHIDHPYGLDEVIREELFQLIGDLREGGRGRDAAPDHPYLYRLTSVGALRHMKTLSWDYGASPGGWTLTQFSSDGQIHEALLAEASGTKTGWLPLGPYAVGSIANPRLFSWWTTYEGLLHNTFVAGRRLGLVDDWIAEDAIVLRCAAGNAKVPNAVDGFEGPVFQACDDATSCPCGQTIDLNGDGEVGPGEPEFVLRPMSTDDLWFRPIRIEPATRRAHPEVPESDVTWERVYRYLDRMEAV